MALDDPLRRLQILQRDLVAFTESRLPNVQRLAGQLDASAEDFKKLLARTRKNEASRAVLVSKGDSQASTIKIGEVEYEVQDQFRQDALLVADELELDELEAAELCIQSPPVDQSVADTTLPYRALVRFHQRREVLLDCLRLLLQLSFDSDAGDDRSDAFRVVISELVRGGGGDGAGGTCQPGSSAYWRKCVDGLSDIESFLHKIADHKEKLVMTGQLLTGAVVDALQVQRQLLTRQHECTAAILAYLIRGNYVQPEDYRAFLSKAAGLDADMVTTIHYIPVLVSGAAYFGSHHATPMEAAADLHNLFAVGPGQLQWKQASLKAAASIFWLAEYNSRFAPGELSPSETDQTKASEGRSALFFDSLASRGLHFVLAAAAFFKPVIWHDPSRLGLITFLLDDSPTIPNDMPRASDDFSMLAMSELQVFTDAFVTNMPDILRTLKTEEDEKRRNFLASRANDSRSMELNLERFIVIMACAYQDDPEAARDFWSDRESNLYGFLRWASKRLPTPRVAAFCQLLRSIASDEKSANQAHRFLLEDSVMTGGKLQKTYSVSWIQIFSELEVYTSWLKDRLTVPQSTSGQDAGGDTDNYEEPETAIMLDAYLGLASHVCKVSPDARNWILKDQPFHLGEVMFQLAKSAAPARVRACCLDMLSSLLTDKIPEVRNGIWVLLDTWVNGASPDSSALSGPNDRQRFPAKQYLQGFSSSAEACASLVNLLNALISPVNSSLDVALDVLPFPEQLGTAQRHTGMDLYVDFTLETIFTRKIPQTADSGEASMIPLLRYVCLEFVFLCLSSFNEDLVLLANTANAGIEAAMETKSLANYLRLHPFARVMEWILNSDVVNALFATMQQNSDDINNTDLNSPFVQSTIKAVQVLNLAWNLQATYFDIVRPVLTTQPSRQRPVPGSTTGSIDELFLPRLDAVLAVATLTTSRHVDLSLACLELLHKISSSRRLSGGAGASNGKARMGSRVLSAIARSGSSLTLELKDDFTVEDWDVEGEEMPLKFVKAKAILDLLNVSLDAADGKPSIAHCLLGFNCYDRTVGVLPHSAFAVGHSLFHSIASCAVEIPVATQDTLVSWLLSIKRGCIDVIRKLATSPLTSSLVRPELRAMEFLAALSRTQLPTAAYRYWDSKLNLDPNLLLDRSALAIRDFMYVREIFFDLCAIDLRTAAEQGSYSVQERVISALLGTIKLPTGESLPTASIFDLFDFFELETTTASDAYCKFLTGIDFSPCTKPDPETVTKFDIKMVEELLILRKRELIAQGIAKEGADEQQIDDEIRATMASLTTQNAWNDIQCARLATLESWTDLLSLMVTKGGLTQNQVINLALQGLLVALPRYEKSLSDNSDAAALLAKLLLTFTHASSPALRDQSQQTANVATERLQSTFRVSLKAITDSTADLALRDVAYRTNCAILASVPQSAVDVRAKPPPAAKQLLQMVQTAGDRLLTVVTEDAFSGRGVTRISALLFLDGIVALAQRLKAGASMLKALTKLNFVPVLIDTSIGSVASAFGEEDELVVSLAYFHTALALLLRLCQTADGTQLVLNSNLFDAIDDSKLFSTDPDIGFDIDNPAALQEFYRILAEVLRVVTATVLTKGPQAARGFLHAYRSTVQAVFKRTSRESGPSEIVDVADEMGRLILATGFLEDEEAAYAPRTDGFT